jgi:predicted ArsR family transcriptional regulator
VNLAQHHAPTLTARLLGDPLPGRYERAQRLREFHQVPDDPAPLDRPQRRARILELLKAGPMTVRDLAEAIDSDPGRVRMAVLKMKTQGAVVRHGSGSGPTSTVVWGLPGSEPPPPPSTTPRPSLRGQAPESILGFCGDPGGVTRGMVADRMGVAPQRATDALVKALNEGFLAKTGAGRFVRYHLTDKAREVRE